MKDTTFNAGFLAGVRRDRLGQASASDDGL